ncbi:hypothetical protein ACLJYM_21585 [Rhizobium giardinii]|uniref:hypothetical protein n=1 Tax=Rhizobium giardinii TaxID=56731 RepID=UPI0039E05649
MVQYDAGAHFCRVYLTDGKTGNFKVTRFQIHEKAHEKQIEAASLRPLRSPGNYISTGAPRFAQPAWNRKATQTVIQVAPAGAGF